MESIFLQVLGLSFAGSIVILLILLSKKWFDGKLSPRFHALVWVIALFILLVPIRTNLPIPSIFSNLNTNMDIVQAEWELLPSTIAESTNQNAQTVLPIKSSTQTIFSSLWRIWMIGMVLFFLQRAVSTLWLNHNLSHHAIAPSATDILILNRLRSKLNIHEEITLYRSSIVPSPLILGLLHCQIFLPETLNTEEEIELSLLHEMIHYRDKHLFYKAISLLVAGIHWFNPFCRIMCRDINFSCELCCDQQVIQSLDASGRLRYGKLLLHTASQSTQILHTGMPLSGKETLKRRLLLIMNYQTSKKLITLCLVGALSCSAMLCGMGVNALVPNNPIPTNTTLSSGKSESFQSPLPSIAMEKEVTASITAPNDSTSNTPTATSDAPTSYVGGNMMYPVMGYDISYTYSWDEIPNIMLIRRKDGKSIQGTPISAANDGIVEKVVLPEEAPKQGYGSYLILNHGGGVTTIYTHCDSISVAKGETVQKGQTIATAGSTGSVDRPAVGFGVREDGLSVDPSLYCLGYKNPPILYSSPGGKKLDLMWPVNGGYISCGFWGYPNHVGLDIAAPSGTDIYAAEDGIVTKATESKNYGNYIELSHGMVTTRYAHCKEFFVEEGQSVKKGDIIASVGRTGAGTGNMCHFEVINESVHLDPKPYIGKSYPGND